MFRQLLSWRSPGGSKGKLSVLIFHRVLAEKDPLFPFDMTAQRFHKLCGWLKKWFNVLPLDQAVIHLQAGTLPERAACLTFDDGYADNLLVAMPILLNHGLSATFFIATGYLDGGRMWNDTIIESIRCTQLERLELKGFLGSEFIDLPTKTLVERHDCIKTLISKIKYHAQHERDQFAKKIAEYTQVQPPNTLMLTSDQVMAMRRAGMLIGAHTVTHPILAGLNVMDAWREIADSKYALELLLGERIGLFAYPNGKPNQDYSSESVDLVRDIGFDAAVSTHHAAASSGTDVFQIPRYTPWERSRLEMGLRLLKNIK